jgi:hypothetical protein
MEDEKEKVEVDDLDLGFCLMYFIYFYLVDLQNFWEYIKWEKKKIDKIK